MKMHLSEANFFIKKIHLSEPNPDLWDCQSHSDDLDGSFNQPWRWLTRSKLHEWQRVAKGVTMSQKKSMEKQLVLHVLENKIEVVYTIIIKFYPMLSKSVFD